MNTLDMIILAVIVVMLISGYVRGFIKTLFNLLSMIITFGLTYYLYPFISRFVMMNTDLYKDLSMRISETFNFEQLFANVMTKESQIEAIQNLPFPDTFKEMLISNNNTEIFNLLDVSSFTEYISGSLASVVINIIVFIGLFIIIFIVLSILVNVLDLIANLPGLNSINRLSGAMLGLIMALGFIFVGLTVCSIIISTNSSVDMVRAIEESTIGSYLYANNPIMDLLNNNIDNNHFWKIISQNQ